MGTIAACDAHLKMQILITDRVPFTKHLKFWMMIGSLRSVIERYFIVGTAAKIMLRMIRFVISRWLINPCPMGEQFPVANKLGRRMATMNP